jgi:hypothetical protein
MNQTTTSLVEHLNENTKDFFIIRAFVAHVKYQSDQIEGFDEPQPVITSVNFRLEAQDLDGNFLDSRVFEIEVPFLTTSTTGGTGGFVPYNDLDFNTIINWLPIRSNFIQEFNNFQNSTTALVETRNNKVEPQILIPNWTA